MSGPDEGLVIRRRPRPDGEPHAKDCGYLSPDHDGPCEPDKVEENSRYLIDLAQRQGGIPFDMIQPDGPVSVRDAMDAENAAEIDRHRARLRVEVGMVVTAAAQAKIAAERLASDSVYDVEMAETADGDAVLALVRRLIVDAAALHALVEKVTRG